MTYYDLGRIYYEWNRLEAATATLERSIILCAEWENLQALVRARVLQSQLWQVQHRLDEAQSTLEAADQKARQTSDPLLVYIVMRRWVTLSLAQGDLGRAQQWAGQLPGDEGPYAFLTGITLARPALACNEPSRALDSLAASWQHVAKLHLVTVQVQTLALQALVHAALRQTQAAKTVLQQALALGQSGGLIRSLVDAGAPLETLLRGIPTSSPLGGYVAELLAAFARDDCEPAASGLTPREHEILRLLAAGLSNRQMAERLIISEGTLKRHVSNLYLQLAVHSRTEALNRAAGLGLVSL